MEDDGGSLFAGMDFVLSADPEAKLTIQTEAAGLDRTTISPQASHLGSEPLDEDLFTGLSMSIGLDSTPSALVVDKTIPPIAAPVDRSRVGDILSAYDEVPPSLSYSKNASVNSVSTGSRYGGRKKKKSVRIGYGRDRDGEDSEDKSSVGGEFAADISENDHIFAAAETSEGAAVIESSEAAAVASESSEVAAATESSEETVSNIPEAEVDAHSEVGVTEVKEDEQREEEIEGEAKMEEFKIENMSIEDKIVAAKEETEKKLKELELKAGEASDSRKAAAQMRRQAAKELSTVCAKRKEMEMELESACEDEDFELADKLSEGIAEAEKVLKEAEALFKEAEVKYDLASSQVEEILAEQTRIEEEGGELLKGLEEEAEAAAERVKREAGEAGDREMERISREEEQLKAKREEQLVQMKEIEEANDEVATAVEESVRPDIEEKKVVAEKRRVLAEELAELMERVKAKEAEIAEQEKVMEEIDARIESVVSEFGEKKAALQAELDEAAAGVKEVEVKEAEIEMGKRRVEEMVANAEAEWQLLIAAALSARHVAEVLKESVEWKRRMCASSRHIKAKKVEFVKKEEMMLADIQELKQQASSSRAALQELSSTKTRLQQEMSSAKQRIGYAEKRVTELESEKRLAAAARNFKEAARLSSEAKALCAERESCAVEVDKCASNLVRLEEEIEERIRTVTGIETEINLKEKEAAKACCCRLRLVAIGARDERQVAVELKDYEEAESLLHEAVAADAEAYHLQIIHGFDDPSF